MKRMMIDLETMGIRSTSEVLSIGAVVWQDGREVAKHYVEIDPEDYPVNYWPGAFTRDESTQKWWAERGGFQPEGEPISVRKAIQHFLRWAKGQQPDEVWANSPTFDCEILRHHIRVLDGDTPWPYWSERDVRTLRAVAKGLGIAPERREPPHHALHDARMQMEDVWTILEALKR